MRGPVARVMARIAADRSAAPGAVAVAALDDVATAEGAPDLAPLAGEVLSRLGCLGLVAARPSLPFADFLVRRAAAGEGRIAPPDAETLTFLHDIPFLRRGESGGNRADGIARLLGRRKGVIVEGLGIVAAGALTVEQAYINYTSVFHAAFVKYLLDLLREGFRLPGEEEAFRDFRRKWLKAPSAGGLAFREGPIEEAEAILAEMAAVGRYTVERGLVDSFFGNISYRRADVVYISRTAASLDELRGQIDPVPGDGSTTSGITASSELPAHRRIYDATGARAILHGHPKFAVVMSLAGAGEEGPASGGRRGAGRAAFLGDAPVVDGESGAGGLARTVPAVIGESGKAIVRGHGVFAIGRTGFAEPFRAMVAVEKGCREAYFRRLDEGPQRG